MVHAPSLRDDADVMQLIADLRNSMGDEIPLFVQHADFYGAPATALDLPPDAGHEHGATADGFAVMPFVIEAQIEVPPVVKQGDEVGHESAGREFARGEAAPTPLVFEFVKAVFRIGAVAVVFWYTDGGEGIRMKKKINCPSRVTGA